MANWNTSFLHVHLSVSVMSDSCVREHAALLCATFSPALNVHTKRAWSRQQTGCCTRTRTSCWPGVSLKELRYYSNIFTIHALLICQPGGFYYLIKPTLSRFNSFCVLMWSVISGLHFRLLSNIFVVVFVLWRQFLKLLKVLFTFITLSWCLFNLCGCIIYFM